jgi:hypothetical protein
MRATSTSGAWPIGRHSGLVPCHARKAMKAKEQSPSERRVTKRGETVLARDSVVHRTKQPSASHLSTEFLHDLKGLI